MAALFRMPFTSAPVVEPTTPVLSKPSLPLPKSPRSYRLPAYPDAREWDERQRRTAPAGVSAQRIAQWDKKRQQCANCKHIYLKTLSRHDGYCSVDCKSNALYLAKVNRTIQAVRSVVQHQKERKQEQEQEQQAAEQPERETPDEDDAEPMAQARTFAEFGRDARLANDLHVEWAFSAVY